MSDILMQPKMSQRIRRNLLTLFSTIIAASSLVGAPDFAAAQVTTLDDFDSRFIKRQFWDGIWTGRTLDTSRHNSGGKLMLALRAYGDIERSSGRDSAGEGVMISPNIARRWSRLEARVRVTSALMRSCTANREPARAQIRIFGRLFADVVDPGTPSTDDTNKVLGYIALERRASDTSKRWRVKYWAGLCKDSDCDIAETVTVGEFSRTIRLGQWANLTLANDIANRQLIFGLNGAVRRRSYSAVVATPVKLNEPVLRLQLDSKTPRCVTAVRSRPFVDLTGEVDWVRINTDALN